MSSSNSLPSRQTSTRTSTSNNKTLIQLIEELKDLVSQAQERFGGGREGGDTASARDHEGSSNDREGATKKDGEEAAAASAAAATEGEWAYDVVAKLSNICGKLLSPIKKSRARKEEGQESSSSSRGGSLHDNGIRPSDQIDKLRINLDQTLDAVKRLDRFEGEFRAKVEGQAKTIAQLLENLKATVPPEQGPSSTPKPVETHINIDETLRDMVNMKFGEFNKEMTKLKHRIPSSSSLKLAQKDDSQKKADGTSSSSATTGAKLDKLLSLESRSFYESPLYEEVQEEYRNLNDKEKKCLLSFALFSENEELKKRMLTYWWAGEGLLTAADGEDKRIEEVAGEGLLTAADSKDKRIEEVAGEILKKFVEKGLIEPVNKKRRPPARAYRMQRVVRSAIVKVAYEAGEFSYDDDTGNIAVKFVGGNEANKKPSSSGSPAAATPEEVPDNSNRTPSSSSSSASSSIPVKDWDQEKLHTIFNVKDPYPDLRMKWLATVKDKSINAEEWFLKMKALKVLYLGTWRASGTHHIEVDSTEFLKGLRNMSSLRLLSLQGISRINELTDSVRGLKELSILDLKACHNLEELPKEISSLKSLTHLDVSDCYMIDHMPKGLSSLVNLQVLKGFVVGDYHQQTGKFCTLEDIVGMKKLRKLSIITSNKMFPTDSELKALDKLAELQKLTLSWGAEIMSITTKVNQPSTNHQGVPPHEEPNEEEVSLDKKQTFTKFMRSQTTKFMRSQTIRASSPSTALEKDQIDSNHWKLEKLDLQCYPQQTTPKWLTPKKLPDLKKLYVRGGGLGDDLGLSKGFEWKLVETLRLKFLAGLKMNWEEMLRMFPNITYLEKVDCPLITLCPCDEEGVWAKEE